MGRAGRKPFIDKKKSTTYNLIYRATEVGKESDPSERLLLEVKAPAQLDNDASDTESDEGYENEDLQQRSSNHPLSWLNPPVENISEARRRELLSLGFPDDGYDYLKHVRVLGSGTAALEDLPDEAATSAGPAVAVPASTTERPETDVKAYNAQALTVHQIVANDDSAMQVAAGVTAFSKEITTVYKRNQEELEEVDTLLAELEDEEVDPEDGFGDMLDDFVLTATEGPPQQQDGAGSERTASSGEEGEDEEVSSASDASDEDVWEEHEEGARRGPGSIASTYWRPAREDRREGLSVIDERFEKIALEYGESEDDLDELAPEACGTSTLQDFKTELAEFLETQREAAGVAEDGKYIAMRNEHALEASSSTQHDDEAKYAAPGGKRAGGSGYRYKEGAPETLAYIECQGRSQWDCESVVSMTSTYGNQPGRIQEPRRKPKRTGAAPMANPPAAPPLIKLSNKTGAPILEEAGARVGRPGLKSDEGTAIEDGNGGAAGLMRRSKGETPEERRQRKTAVKEAKREARSRKKELKLLYKDVEVKQKRNVEGVQRSILPIN